MKKYKYLILSAVLTISSVAYLGLSGKFSSIAEYVNVIGQLTSLKNESESLKTDYAQNSKVLTEKGVITDLETLESFSREIGDLTVKEVAVFKFIGNEEELVAEVPSLYDAFAMKSGDLIRVTYSVGSGLESVLNNLKKQKIVYREIIVIPLNNEIQITFLI